MMIENSSADVSDSDTVPDWGDLGTAPDPEILQASHTFPVSHDLHHAHAPQTAHDFGFAEIPDDPNFVIFRGWRVERGWPKKLAAAQKITELTLEDGTPDGSGGGRGDGREGRRGRKISRTLWKDNQEKWLDQADRWSCRHCGAAPDEYHILGCNYENCPNCLHQLRGCECRFLEYSRA